MHATIHPMMLRSLFLLGLATGLGGSFWAVRLVVPDFSAPLEGLVRKQVRVLGFDRDACVRLPRACAERRGEELNREHGELEEALKEINRIVTRLDEERAAILQERAKQKQTLEYLRWLLTAQSSTTWPVIVEGKRYYQDSELEGLIDSQLRQRDYNRERMKAMRGQQEKLEPMRQRLTERLNDNRHRQNVYLQTLQTVRLTGEIGDDLRYMVMELQESPLLTIKPLVGDTSVLLARHPSLSAPPSPASQARVKHFLAHGLSGEE